MGGEGGLWHKPLWMIDFKIFEFRIKEKKKSYFDFPKQIVGYTQEPTHQGSKFDDEDDDIIIKIIIWKPAKKSLFLSQNFLAFCRAKLFRTPTMSKYVEEAGVGKMIIVVCLKFGHPVQSSDIYLSS